MWIGTIGLIGFWPLAKDAILASALQKGGTTASIVWVGGLIGAFFTGVYATRLMRLTFYGRRSTYADVHLHDTSHGEAPRTMFWTVAALAAGMILSGFLAIGFGTRDELASWLRFVAPTIDSTVRNEVLTTAMAWGVGLAGAILVWWLYARPERLAAFKRPLAGGAAVAENLFYWDAAYRWIAHRRRRGSPRSTAGSSGGSSGAREPGRLRRARSAVRRPRPRTARCACTPPRASQARPCSPPTSWGGRRCDQRSSSRCSRALLVAPSCCRVA
jgi:NADH:ubiquinone oxidoreductase subunit 5 (subunit L)/multisubunit Na+/H+ antiporter MnhA subunit